MNEISRRGVLGATLAAPLVSRAETKAQEANVLHDPITKYPKPRSRSRSRTFPVWRRK
jgi:hypothetical protein